MRTDLWWPHLHLLLCVIFTTTTTRTTEAFSIAHGSTSSLKTQSSRLASFSTNYWNDNQNDSDLPSTSASFAIHPMEVKAVEVTKRLGLSESQHKQLAALCSCVVFWNERINLVSRKDCAEDVVFGRHVLPSLAIMSSLISDEKNEEEMRVIDVGTGGGFPGLPLAIALPDVQFVLVDSVGKKLAAVQEMAEELGLQNVQTHHSRVEEMVDDELNGHLHLHNYDFVLGRSVTKLPRFCFWVSDLLKRDTGRLLYIIGGDLEDKVLSKLSADVCIDDLLGEAGSSDKRLLTMQQPQVQLLADESGEIKRIGSAKRQRSNPRRKNRAAKGAWSKRDSSNSKQRGYEGFKRYGY